MDVTSVDRLAQELTVACKDLSSDPSASTVAKRQNIIQKAHEIIHSVSSPGDFFSSLFANAFTMLSLRTLMYFDVLSAIPSNGTAISLPDLAASTNFQESLLERLLAPLTAAEVLVLSFSSDSTKQYTHTSLSLAFNEQDAPGTTLFPIIYDHSLSGMIRLREWLNEDHASKEPADPMTEPEDISHAPVSWVHGMKGKNVFDVITEKGDLDLFQRAMAAMNKNHSFPQASEGFFDFASLIPSDDDGKRKLLIDIGGGYGRTIKSIVTCTPQLLNLTDRIVLEDLGQTIKQAKQAGLMPPGVQTLVHNMFTPQPPEARNARAYFLRRLLHDWSDDLSLQILTHVVDAMGPDSVVLLNERVMPEELDYTSAEVLCMDMTMMGIGGKERSEKHWRELLGKAGLVLHKIYPGKGDIALIEARLKR